jgi:F-type H+-transporting ATPase subunit delta
VADSSNLISGVAGRYASSLFDLALEAQSIDKVGEELSSFEAVIAGNDDLKRLIESPVFSAEDQFNAISALADKAKISGLTGNFLRVVAQNRRLFTLPAIARGFRELAARHRGEVTADVVSAHELSAAQTKELQSALKSVTGKTVAINLTVDPSLLGGLIVKIGSRQIDTSLRTKLSTLKLSLKEVG